VARYDLGLPEDEIGTLTHALFSELLERKRIAERNEFIRAGIIAAAVINIMGAPDKPVSELDFVPPYLQEPTDKTRDDFDLRELSPEEQARYVLAQFRKKTFVRR
jgi:hypothetical protein